MSKKKETMIKLMAVFTITAMLLLSMTAQVFAAEPPPEPGVVPGTESEPARAAITKMLQTPVNTSFPKVDFTFIVEKVSLGGVSTEEEKAKMPDIGPFVLEYEAGETPCMNMDDVLMLHKETDDIFDGARWPHAGEFKYKVYEVKVGEDIVYKTPEGADYTDKLEYSAAEYEVTVYVANGATPGSLYVSGIGAKIIINDESNEGQTGKVDATPGKDKEGHVYSQMIFTNTYIKYPGGTDPTLPEDTALRIGKTVTGAYGDKSLPFEFSISVSCPIITHEPISHFQKAYLMQIVTSDSGSETKNMTNTSSVDNAELIDNDDDGLGNYIIFDPDQPVKVYMTHGQWLAFPGLPAGASVKVTESGTPEYRPGYSIVLNGQETPTTSIAPNYGDPWSIPTTPPQYIGEKTNTIEFTNTHQDITLTGISVNDLPFIIIIAIAAIVLAVYIVIKARRSRNNNA